MCPHTVARNLRLLTLLFASLVMASTTWPQSHTDRYFTIQVVDEATGRGVPLVELRTTSNQTFVTDSNGLVAIDEPGYMNRSVFFHVSSHGYEFPADGFGMHGRALEVQPGGGETLNVRRINIAERLYRITGEGIYSDSVRLGREIPIAEPLLNAQVTGQDSVQTAVYQDKIFWFWGDTNRLRYPLGHFGTAGAVSELPGQGGLDPDRGLDLVYFMDESGFSRPKFQLERKGLVWTDAVFTISDADGNERLVCHYSVMKDLGTRLEHGLAVYDDQLARFVPKQQLADDARLYPHGHALFVDEGDAGRRYLYFANPYPLVRVAATWEAVFDLEQYEAFTPLVAGADEDRESLSLDRDDRGKLRYGWKRNTAALSTNRHRELARRGMIDEGDSWLRTVNVDDGKPVLLHGGTVNWNAHRQKWVMIAVELFGTSLLGEIWYAEADKPEGPWPKAVKVVTHEKYSFYNPAHHPFFDQDGGRRIYFEGTYTTTFSGNDNPTPRYNYNQIMYRLDLDDPRLANLRAAAE